jgi:5'-3' exonuclease
MGIPSFYRQLCKKYPAIIAKSATGVVGSEWLCLDFNCAMYWVLRQMRPLSDNQYAWEGELCEAIAAYMTELIQLVRPSVGAFVSCDGVVCAAKRRQQRLRRFKGPWTASAESAILGKAVNSGWDQNALTPGSAFMKRLGDVLTAAGAALSQQLGIRVIVSTTSEPGEGEHKLLAAMRRERPASCVIYGLDADLILLALLLVADTGANVSLLRETQEFERGGGRDGDGGWRILSIPKLQGAMFASGAAPEYVRDFVAGMSLLGNDFLPHALTRTVRDDGIPQLLQTLQQQLWSQGQFLVDPTNGQIRREGILALLRNWSTAESGDMFMSVLDAYKAMRYSVGEGETPEQTALREWNALPARWGSLTRILAPSRKELVPQWKEIYRNVWGGGGHEHEYLQGVAWVWDYYSGRSVDQGWMFEAHLPPLWCDLVAHLENQTVMTHLAAPAVRYPTALPEWIHLLAVLPMDSVQRLLPKDKHRLAAEHPWFWPASWKIFDVGRSQMWECEPMIPLLPEALLRANA